MNDLPTPNRLMINYSSYGFCVQYSNILLVSCTFFVISVARKLVKYISLGTVDYRYFLNSLHVNHYSFLYDVLCLISAPGTYLTSKF